MSDKKINVSVVMSVFNNAVGVQKTIDSVLQQKGISLDFVIIDDGAEQAVKQLLSQYKNDARIHIAEQQNQGLTAALIKGCELAKYDYIARIDGGDIAKPERLKKQANFLNQHLETVCVTSWVEMITEEGYPLYDVRLGKEQIQKGLSTNNIDCLIGPLHFSSMFRKSAYIQAGKYRPQFYFVQDLDLWLRMQYVGEFSVISEVLTIAEFADNAISARYRNQQQQLKKYAFESNQLKQQNKSDVIVLEKASFIRPENIQCFDSDNKCKQNANGLYFIARCLLKHNPQVAVKYLKRVIKINPLHIRAYILMMMIWLKLNVKQSNEI